MVSCYILFYSKLYYSGLYLFNLYVDCHISLEHAKYVFKGLIFHLLVALAGVKALLRKRIREMQLHSVSIFLVCLIKDAKYCGSLMYN